MWIDIIFYLITMSFVLFEISNRVIRAGALSIIKSDAAEGGYTLPPIIISIVFWFGIDAFWAFIIERPIPIVLFLICWVIKLVNDQMRTNKAQNLGMRQDNIEIHIHMAEAWVLFIWAIGSMFLNYRTWF